MDDLVDRRDVGLLTQYGWSRRVARVFETHPQGTPGRVARLDGSSCVVVTPDSLVRAHIATGEAPVTGDWVSLEVSATGAAVIGLIERSSELARLDPHGVTRQVLAANVDQVLIVHGFDRPVRRSRIERTVAMAWESGATPIAVLNKIDLDGTRRFPLDIAGALAVVRRAAPGIDVLAVSARSGEGIAELIEALEAPGTAALIGESGAGKSSLVNALTASERMATGPTRRGDHKGRHTTSARELIPVSNGTVLMDTPGLRAIALAEGLDGVARTFPEIVEMASRCRFRDCNHDSEPGCGVTEALDAGTIEPGRVEGYRKLRREVSREERRMAARRRRDSNRRSRRPAAETRRRGLQWEDEW